MSQYVNWFEIPVTQLDRAKAFYEGLLSIEINVVDMHGTKMGFFPNDGKGVSGALVQGEGYVPSKEGALVYLNGGKDLSTCLARVEKLGGQVIVPKTEIAPDVGFFAIFLDSEKNKMAFHSVQ